MVEFYTPREMPAPAEAQQPLDKVLPLRENPAEPIPSLSAFAPRRLTEPRIITISGFNPISHETLDTRIVRTDLPVPPSQKQKKEANSSTSFLGNVRRSPWFRAAEFGGLGAAAIACAAPAVVMPSESPKPTGEVLGASEVSVQALSAKYMDLKNHYLGHGVEAEDASYNEDFPPGTAGDLEHSAINQCMDFAFAVMDEYGWDRAIIREPSANLVSSNPRLKERFSVSTEVQTKSPGVGSFGILGNHIFLSSGETKTVDGVLYVKGLSQNWNGKNYVDEDWFRISDLTAVLTPNHLLGPQGTYIKFNDIQGPSESIQPPGPTPEATVDLSELTVEQQASYAVAKNFFDFLSMGNFERSDQHIESSIVIPQGITKEDIIRRMALGETVTLDQPIEYYWLSYNDNDTNTVVTRAQVLLNDLYLDRTDNPVSSTDSRNKLLAWGRRDIMANAQWSGVTGYKEKSKKEKFLETVRDMDLPPLSPWQLFGILEIAVMTDSETRLFPDLVTGHTNSCFGCDIGSGPLDQRYDAIISPSLNEFAEWYALNSSYLESIDP